jgi:hypothetical protein
MKVDMASINPPFKNAADISNQKIDSLARGVQFNKKKNRFEVTVAWNGRNITVWHKGNLSTMDINAAQQRMKSELRKILTLADIYRLGRGGATTKFAIKGDQLFRTTKDAPGTKPSHVPGSPYKAFKSFSTKKSSSLETLFLAKQKKVPEKIRQKKADLKALEDEMEHKRNTEGAEAVEYANYFSKYEEMLRIENEIKHLELREKLMSKTMNLFKAYS